MLIDTDLSEELVFPSSGLKLELLLGRGTWGN
jgi:hypothetical protein